MVMLFKQLLRVALLVSCCFYGLLGAIAAILLLIYWNLDDQVNRKRQKELWERQAKWERAAAEDRKYDHLYPPRPIVPLVITPAAAIVKPFVSKKYTLGKAFKMLVLFQLCCLLISIVVTVFRTALGI